MEKNDTDIDLLIVDNDMKLSRLLSSLIESYSIINSVNSITVHNVLPYLKKSKCNTIFIDPLAEDIDYTSNLIFRIRREFPGIVFVLFLDFINIENNAHFFIGERQRLRHYFKLNKRTPLHLLDAELVFTLYACQNDLRSNYTSFNYDAKSGINKTTTEILGARAANVSISVKNLIALDKLGEALKVMKNYYEKEDESVYNELVLLSLMYNNSEKNKSINTVTNSEYMQAKMKVASSIINILNRVKT